MIFRRGRRVNGRAHYPGAWYYVDPKRGARGGLAKIKMWLPRPPDDPEQAALFGDAMKEELAKVLLHEIDHTLGLRHDEMAPWRSIDVPWIEAMPLRREEEKVGPSAEQRRAARVEAREARARAKLAEWQRRLRAAQRKVGEYKRKVRYYDKRREAASRGGRRTCT